MTDTKKQKLLQAIPKVDEFLGWLEDVKKAAPDFLVKKAVREVLAEKRQAILAGDLLDMDELLRLTLVDEFVVLLSRYMQPNFRTVINATGVVVHTNMGRSLLPVAAMKNLSRVGSSYSNLEFDLATGKRGSRYSLVEEMLCELTGAEAALVVNNNAAAVLLTLGTIAENRQVIVSRGQLVEIGGSFRIPDVMTKSGARLVEVGATNRTHPHDYENAITEETAMLLKVHTSNYRVIGFTSEVSLPDLVDLGHKHGLPVMEDLGSGCLVDLSRFGLPKEPTVGEVVKSGVDIVTFSGDKLLGGPQAGIILGKKDIIGQVKKNPLNRALRIDKFTLAGLESILRIYYDERSALHDIPTLAMLSVSLDVLVKRANRLLRRTKKRLAGNCDVRSIASTSRVGGGALPEHDLATRAVELKPRHCSVNALEAALRAQDIPIIGRIEHDSLLLDMRTVADVEIVLLADTLISYFSGNDSGAGHCHTVHS